MDLHLKDRVVLITGSSHGLGLAMARSLAGEGARLMLSARREEGLTEAADRLRDETSAEVATTALDLTREETAERLVQATIDRFARLDVLINNIGGAPKGPFAERSDQDWRLGIDLDLMSHVRVTRAALAHLREGSAILFTASLFGRESGGPGRSIYTSTKAAVIGLAKTLAIELAPKGIRVNSLAPGSIRFPGGSWDRRAIADPQAIEEFVARELPMGRFGTAEEVGDVAAFLVSDRASWITGACISVDGGQGRTLV